MSRHSSISSYYQSSSRPDSPAPLSSNPQQQQPQPEQQQQSRNQKADQILQNFYVKVIQIVILARVTQTDPLAGLPARRGSLRAPPIAKKTSKWFNLELEELEIYKEDARYWRAAAVTESPPGMLVELFLDTSDMTQHQTLVLIDEKGRKCKVDVNSASYPSGLTPSYQGQVRRNILLESWSLILSNTVPDPVPEPPVVYKKSIIFFRSLYAYMRLLPAYQLYRRLRKHNHTLKIGFRISRGHSPEDSFVRDSEIGLEVPLLEGETRPMISENRFGQVETTLGNCDFQVDESEAVLSSKFIDMDENYFTPTVVAHSQDAARSTRRLSVEVSSPRRQPSSALMSRGLSTDTATGGHLEQSLDASTGMPRRNSIQSFQQRSGEISSSQSSISSLGTPPFRTGPSQLDVRRQLSSNFSPFKSPSLSSSPSPSYLEAIPTSMSSRPSSIHLHRSPSSSSMSRVQSSTHASNIAGSIPKTLGGGTSSSIGGVNQLSSSIKSNASSSMSAPRVTSSFGHRYDSSGRRASSESSPASRGNRNSVVGSSSLFQFASEDEDVSAFVRMLATPEPLKMFGKPSASGMISGENISASTISGKTSLGQFQQLKQYNVSLSESMSASQTLPRDHHVISAPLTINTLGHRRSTLGGIDPSPPSPPFAVHTSSTTTTRHSQSLAHQPGTPSPLHSEIPVYPVASDKNNPSEGRASPRIGSMRSLTSKRDSWRLSDSRGSGSNSSIGYDAPVFSRRTNVSNIAFRHGSLDQGKDIVGVEDALERIDLAAMDSMTYGSYPEDMHHQHSVFSAPLMLARNQDGDTKMGRMSTDESTLTTLASTSTDPRPIPLNTMDTIGSSGARQGMLRRSTGLRQRVGGDDDSMTDSMTISRERAERYEYEGGLDGKDLKGSHQHNDPAEKPSHGINNDDDDMLFIMSELSPGSHSGLEIGGTGGEMNMLPLNSMMMNLRSQSQTPAMYGPPHPHALHQLQTVGIPGSNSTSGSPRPMSRGGSDRGGISHSGNNSGQSSHHSESRGRIDGW